MVNNSDKQNAYVSDHILNGEQFRPSAPHKTHDCVYCKLWPTSLNVQWRLASLIYDWLFLVWDLRTVKGHSRSNMCSSSFLAMSCCRAAGFTASVRDSWSFKLNASSLRKRDLQKVERHCNYYCSTTVNSINWSFGIDNKHNSLLDL